MSDFGSDGSGSSVERFLREINNVSTGNLDSDISSNYCSDWMEKTAHENTCKSEEVDHTIYEGDSSLKTEDSISCNEISVQSESNEGGQRKNTSDVGSLLENNLTGSNDESDTCCGEKNIRQSFKPDSQSENEVVSDGENEFLGLGEKDCKTSNIHQSLSLEPSQASNPEYTDTTQGDLLNSSLHKDDSCNEQSTDQSMKYLSLENSNYGSNVDIPESNEKVSPKDSISSDESCNMLSDPYDQRISEFCSSSHQAKHTEVSEENMCSNIVITVDPMMNKDSGTTEKVDVGSRFRASTPDRTVINGMNDNAREANNLHYNIRGGETSQVKKIVTAPVFPPSPTDEVDSETEHDSCNEWLGGNSSTNQLQNGGPRKKNKVCTKMDVSNHGKNCDIAEEKNISSYHSNSELETTGDEVHNSSYLSPVELSSSEK
ncbi:hypothetical protein QAD02_009657 [Eretmocerus hayati]|uniref:Uncharacterized protein n=1 Tax=Eretmocerus hayati TaxID=131215 RepID=A0ACC2NAC0_9HYME|nr:hypothetical protein QAD02_009657 [Eretmocerus hayati]